MSLLHFVCYYGSLDSAKFICENIDTRKVSPVNSYRSKTAIDFACDWGHVEIVDYLFNNYKGNVDKQINQFDYTSFKPILNVCKNGSLDCVKSLI